MRKGNMRVYYFNEPPKLKLSDKIGNFVSQKIARQLPKHLEKLAEDAHKDTHKDNYMHEVFGGVHRAIDVHRKKSALKKLYKMTENRDVVKANNKFKELTHGMSIPQIRSMRLGLKEAYRNAGKYDD